MLANFANNWETKKESQSTVKLDGVAGIPTGPAVACTFISWSKSMHYVETEICNSLNSGVTLVASTPVFRRIKGKRFCGR